MTLYWQNDVYLFTDTDQHKIVASLLQSGIVGMNIVSFQCMPGGSQRSLYAV
jgi:hypothetical protein